MSESFDNRNGSRPSLRSFFSSSSSGTVNQERPSKASTPTKEHASTAMVRDGSSANHDGEDRHLGSGNNSPSASNSSSHRFFLRKKNSRSSLSPQTSSTSLTSLLKKNKNHSYEQINRNRRTSSASVLHHPAGPPDNNSSTSIHEHHEPTTPNEDHEINNKKTKHTNHHHHLSLKRFLKKLKHHENEKSDSSPKNILPQHSSSDLYRKYGGLGKLIGSGASGSVNLVTSKTDPNEIFAVKKFRPKLPNESEHDYKVKVKNEFKIGQYLNHENLIHTIELIKENGSKLLADSEYYIIMEYCPFDFFNLVMSGLMSQEEVCCYFKQITNGVAHLHENGIAHRDLKLDNCVVNQEGILKLIDFGSAVQFRKEKTPNKPVAEEDDINENYRLLRARGVVGSDPYLSPEVFEPSNFGYDPRTADIWSIAVIFCCMILKRFPWKIPKASDPSYRSFANIDENNNKLSEQMNENFDNLKISNNKHPKGPDRLLRLLPTESRSLIKNMLEIDPKKRYLIDDVLNNLFFQSIEYCHVITETQDEKEVKTTQKSPGHSHHLVTEEDLKKITMEKERAKKLKDSGVA